MKKLSKKAKIIILILLLIILFVAIFIFIKMRLNPFTEKNFKRNINNVIAENSKLSDLRVNDKLIVYYDEFPIGVFIVGKKGILGCNNSTTKVYQINEMMIATFMSVDKSLEYSDAEKISRSLDANFAFGGDSIEKNNIKYEWNSKANNLRYKNLNMTCWTIIKK